MAGLHFVFLQGMPSPFFSRIAVGLEALGCKVTGIALCFGDWMFWRRPNTVHYRGRLRDWPQFLAGFIDANRVTDIVLLGEHRSYHELAVEAAKGRGIRVTVTDFGYLRPDWITLEADGMSGCSRFPRDPGQILRLASALPEVDLAPRYADSSWKMAVGDLLYSFGNVLLWWLYPFYRRSDRRPHPLIYFPAIGVRLLRVKAGHRRARQRVKSLIEAGARYFVFPLQLEHDFQIVAYSPFDRFGDAVRMVIASFAAHSDSGSRLLVKVHPWDPGLRNWGRLVQRWAREFGAEHRVEYLDGGDLDELIVASLGMVTVNSTSGLRALQLGSPVKVLGEAIYDVSGLTFQGSLDKFWTGASKPDAALVRAFVGAMAGTVQIRGVFFDEPGLGAAVRAAVGRLYTGTAGTTQLSARVAQEAAASRPLSSNCR